MERAMVSFFPATLVRDELLGAGDASIVGSAALDAVGEAALEDMPPKRPPNWVTITISNNTPRDTAAINFVRLSAPNFTTPTSNKSRT
jgi:hypothetical protein